MKLPIRILGTNTSKLSAGNHWVDVFYQVPFAYDKEYIPTIKKIVEEEKVDLVIPATDFEVHYLSAHKDELNCKVACSSEYATGIYLDKYKTWEFHLANQIPFAESCLPSQYSGQFGKAIAKPRKGRGSKGIVREFVSTKTFDDSEYLIQKLYEGVEVTTAVYARYSDGKFHGLISLERSLENGATTYCKVVKEYDDKLYTIAAQMIDTLKLKGSFNIQSIVTYDGMVFPFEVNCRISGTNSIRQGFGFMDVRYTIEELLLDKEPEKVSVTEGVAYRYLSDVIYPSPYPLFDLTGDKSDSFFEF